MWGSDGRQDYYKAGREIKTINKSDIDCICSCGFLTLNPKNEFEGYNGGLTVKRSEVVIVDDKDGKQVYKLRAPKKGNPIKVQSCNACVNDWR